jgi:F420-non-reducing hydrogenase iron-sulfur subunit
MGNGDNGFEPKILAFCCNWCSYAGADLAGTSRYKYPANVLILRVLCSGRVDPGFVLKAFEKGMDGVLIAGCHIGDCHYISGNVKAEERVKMIRSLLKTMGIEDERLRLEWVSASEGKRFAKVIEDFVDTLKGIGPINIGGEGSE